MRLSPITRAAAITSIAVLLAQAPLDTTAQENRSFQIPSDFSEMVSARLPSVVGILSTVEASPQADAARPQLPPGLEDFFGLPLPDPPAPGPMQSQGSGFIISEDGFVVTNNHVIAGAEAIEVVLENETRLNAELVGTDPATDIALLKVETDEDLPAVAWGDSTSLEIGDWVVAIGNPFGLGGTVTAGIVSARSRDINAGPYDDFLQTDAAINRGNSGGPLFDASGRVMGVNTAIFSPTGGSVGIGFAVPSHVASRIVADLKDDGIVERGWLGVRIQPVSEELAEALGLDSTEGILVSEVVDESPAERAGLQAGDVITELTGTAMTEPRMLTFGIAELAVGEEVSLTYLRDGEARTTQIVIGRLPAEGAMQPQEPSAPDANSLRLGVSAAPLTPELRAELAIPASVSGLALMSVQPNSPASEAGLRRGDVVTKAGSENVTDVDQLTDAIASAAESERPLLLRIWRNGGYSFVAVTIEQSGQ
jgi:serine protease Do